MSNTYVIADLHGRFDLLMAALKLIEQDAGPKGGRFIWLGDMIDRGPHSKYIIQHFIEGPTSPNWEWIVLQGNHEDIMLQCLAEPRKLGWWIGNGGGTTLESYGYQHGDDLFPLKIPIQHLDWLIDLPLTFEDDLRIFVHAGVPHDQQVLDTKQETLQWMLYKSAKRYAGSAETHSDKPHISGKHIVHGHEQSASHPLLLPHRTNLDSFAWHSGELAIGVFDNSQPQPVRTLRVVK